MPKVAPYKKEQAKFRKLNQPKFYAKGEDAGIANAAGQHMARIGGKVVMLSRKEAHRRGGVDRSKSKKGAQHKVNPPKQAPWQSGSNKERFQLRKQMRVEREAMEARSHGKQDN